MIPTFLVMSVAVVIFIVISWKSCQRLSQTSEGNYVSTHQNAAFNETKACGVGGCRREAAREGGHVGFVILKNSGAAEL